MVHTDDIPTKLWCHKSNNNQTLFVYIMIYVHGLVVHIVGFTKSQQNTTNTTNHKVNISRWHMVSLFCLNWQENEKVKKNYPKHTPDPPPPPPPPPTHLLTPTPNSNTHPPNTHPNTTPPHPCLHEIVTRSVPGYLILLTVGWTLYTCRNSAIRQERWEGIILTFQISKLFDQPRVSHNRD